MLDALVPHAHVGTLVHPLHYSVAMALIIIIVSFVAIA